MNLPKYLKRFYYQDKLKYNGIDYFLYKPKRLFKAKDRKELRKYERTVQINEKPDKKWILRAKKYSTKVK